MKRAGIIVAAVASLGVVAVVGVGCVSDGPPPKPEPRPIPAQPQSITADRIAPFVDQFARDTDADGRPDTVVLTVYLFNSGYPYALSVPGTFEFELRRPDSVETLASWRFTPEQAARALVRLNVGPGYLFHLDLREAGAGKLNLTFATLVARFTPADGGRTISGGGGTVHLGQGR